MTATAPKPEWRNRIVSHGEQPANQFLAHEMNARRHPAAQRDALRGSLDTLGWVGPVIVSQATGKILDGHARVEEALSRDEAAPVPYVEVDVSEAEEKQILAVYDPIGALAEYDRDALDSLLREVEAGDAALDEMLAGLAAEQGLETSKGKREAPEAQIDRAAELQEKWQVERGQVWQIGRHRLMCGDSTDKADVAAVLSGERADIVFTDPPYGVNVTGKGGDPIAGDISFTAIPLMFARLKDAIKPKAWIYICGGQSNMPLYGRMFEEYFRQLPRLIVWDKGKTAVLRHAGYHSCFELIYFTFTEGAGGKWYSSRESDCADDIWRFRAPSSDVRVHLTEKPVDLPRRAIENTCPPGGIVWEPFAGSGSTIVAAEQCDRICRAIEMSLGYVGVILERLSQMGLTPQLLN